MKKTYMQPQMAVFFSEESLPIATSQPEVGIKTDEFVDAGGVESKQRGEWDIWEK